MRGFRPWRSGVFRVIRAAAEGLVLVLAGGGLLALAVYAMGLPSARVLRAVSGVIWGIAAFCSGRRAGLHGRRHGAGEGALVGAVLFLLKCCGAVLLGNPPALFPACISMTVCAMLGGMVGVNTRLRKPPG